MGKSPDSSLDKSLDSSQEKEGAKAPSTDRRKSPRLLPLIEYGAAGTYVVVCPERGRLECLPDSPEWFAWLAPLPSFRFMGISGRFTAHRGGSKSPNSTW